MWANSPVADSGRPALLRVIGTPFGIVAGCELKTVEPGRSTLWASIKVEPRGRALESERSPLVVVLVIAVSGSMRRRSTLRPKLRTPHGTRQGPALSTGPTRAAQKPRTPRSRALARRRARSASTCAAQRGGSLVGGSRRRSGPHAREIAGWPWTVARHVTCESQRWGPSPQARSSSGLALHRPPPWPDGERADGGQVLGAEAEGDPARAPGRSRASRGRWLGM